MNIEWNNEKGWLLDGQSQEDFEGQYQSFSNEDLHNLGILEEGEEETKIRDDSSLTTEELSTRPKDLEFESTSDLSFDEVMADVGQTMKNEWNRAFHRKEDEERYYERTELAKTVREMQRVLVAGAATDLAIIGAGAAAGSIIPAAGTAAGAAVGGTIVAARKIKLLMALAPKLVKFSQLATGTVWGQLATGAAVDLAISRKEDNEGNMFNALEEFNVPLAQTLAQHDDDPDWVVRGKTAINGLIAGGMLFGGLKLGGKVLKKLNKKATEETTEKALEETSETLDKAIKAGDNQSLIDKVKQTIQQCEKEGIEDVERYLLDSEWVKETDPDKVIDIYKRTVDGEDLILDDKGNIQTAIHSWKDVNKVSPEELKRQTNNDGIELMEEAVKDTWQQRGWLAEGEDLVKYTDPKDNSGVGKVTVNTKATNRIVKQYKDKWQLDNNIKVEWVDGQINKADGNTLATSYLGKKVKDNQIAIDKKKLQIKELEDKITMLEGGNKEVQDPLNVLKEKLRIANAELEKLTKTPDIHPDITIQINKNAKNPHAILRSELEHARDIAKRTVPNQKAQHFSRYSGKNESEMSLGYVKKKADTRAGKEQIIDEIFNLSSTTTKLDDFVNNKSMTETTVKDLLGDDKFYTKEGILDDIADVKISKVPKEELSESGNVSTKAYVEYDENSDIISIKIVSDMSADDVEFCILHERKHIEQIKLAKTDENVAKQLEELNELGKDPKNYLAYHSHPLEQEADKYAVDLINKKRTFNEHTRTERVFQEEKPNLLDSSRTNETGNERGRSLQSSNGTSKPTSNNSNQPISKQLTSTEGDLDQVEKVVSDVVAKDTDLSGTTWEALAKDADSLFDKLEEYGVKGIDNLKEAFNQGQIDVINTATRYALAAERLVGDLREQAAEIIKQGGDITEIAEALAYLSDFTSKIGSALGRGLNEVKVVNKARTFFSLTTLEKQGLDNLTDLLYTDITSLNFTRNAKQVKADLYAKVQNYVGGEFFNELMANGGLRKNFDNVIDELLALAKKGELNTETINKKLQGLIKQTKIEDIKNGIQFAVDDKAFAENQTLTSRYKVKIL